MPGETLTNKPVSAQLKNSSHIIVSQNENVDGEIKQALRRIPVAVLKEFIGVDELDRLMEKIPFVKPHISEWTEAEFGSYMNELGKKVDDAESMVSFYEGIGEYAGESAYISGSCVSGMPLYIFKDSLGNVIEFGYGSTDTGVYTEVEDYKITIPAGSHTVYINGQNADLKLSEKFEAGTDDIADGAVTREKLSDGIKSEIKTKADEIVSSASGKFITVTDGADKKIKALTLYGESVQNGIPTPDAPVDVVSVGEGGGVTVNSSKKNLLPQWIGTTVTKTGITFTKNEDGSVFLEGTATTGVSAASVNTVLPAGDYIISGASGGASAAYSLQLRYLDDSGSLSYVVVYDGDVAFTFTESKNITVYAWVVSGATVSTTIYPMIRLADNTDSTYEPYEGISAEVTVSEPLRALPVVTGGNVTIDGQEYIADVLCVNADGSGCVTRNVVKARLTPTSAYLVGGSLSGTNAMQLTGVNIKTNVVNVMCTHLNNKGEKNAPSEGCISCSGTKDAYFRINLPGYSEEEALNLFTENEVYLCYAPVTPTTENLTAEQVTSLLALETYKSVANLYNFDGAYMEVEYVADTKNYIDNKFEELKNAILAQGGNV